MQQDIKEREGHWKKNGEWSKCQREAFMKQLEWATQKESRLKTNNVRKIESKYKGLEILDYEKTNL